MNNLIITGDDFGPLDGINNGIFKAIEEGKITSVASLTLKIIKLLLIKQNTKFLTITNEVNDFNTPWKNYEPVLSRHMNESNLIYYHNKL